MNRRLKSASNGMLGAMVTYINGVEADKITLLRRYTETRRRHPLAAQGRIADGIARWTQAITSRAATMRTSGLLIA